MTPDQFDAAVREGLRQYMRASPERELRRALAAGDTSFVTVMGIGMSAPGLDDAQWHLVERHGWKTIPLASDAISSQAHSDYCVAADAYAERYNRLLLDHLGAAKDASGNARAKAAN